MVQKSGESGRSDESEERLSNEELGAVQDAAQERKDQLDEIDDVLEVNAEEFVKGFIQKGGQ